MSAERRIVGLGAGGHAKVVLEIARAAGFEVVGLLDPRSELHGRYVLNTRVLGGDELLPSLLADGVEEAFIGVGSTGDLRPRARVYEHALSAGMTVPTLVHPAAVVSPSAIVGAGATLAAAAVVSADATLGRNVLVNTCAVVEHDCVVGDDAHIATGAKLAGGARIGSRVHVGLGAVVNQGVTIGDGSIVGSGAVVLADVAPGVVVAGVPARVIRDAGR